MSIERIKGFVAFVCDHCDDGFESTTRNFNDALEELRHEGWRIRRIGVEWHHFCSLHCEQSYIAEERKKGRPI